MTRSGYISSKRILKGVLILQKLNTASLQELNQKQNQLIADMKRLSGLMGNENYADARLLLPMARRVGSVAKLIKSCEDDLAKATRKDIKYSKIHEILTSRIKKYEAAMEEEEWNEVVSSMVAREFASQSATSKLP